jgi:hypothetical protein
VQGPRRSPQPCHSRGRSAVALGSTDLPPAVSTARRTSRKSRHIPNGRGQNRSAEE